MAALSGETNRPDMSYAALNSHLGLTSTTPTRTADRAAITRGRCATGAADHLGPSVSEGGSVSIADAQQPAQPDRRQRFAGRMRILSARLRALTWRAVRLTTRHFLAGFAYTAGSWVATEVLGHATIGASPLMLLWHLVQ
ncbi:hypothetical protein [Streptomyces fradiae]|uniref:hypothetical protein n=1 Tax=Streptomyces fradiae TaxID=1906 RepID=UPI003986D5D4